MAVGLIRRERMNRKKGVMRTEEERKRRKEMGLTLEKIRDVSFKGNVGRLFNQSMKVNQNLGKVPVEWKF